MSEISGISDAVDAVDAIYSLQDDSTETEASKEIQETPEAKAIGTDLSPEQQLQLILNEGGTKQELTYALQMLFGKKLVTKVMESGLCYRWPERVEKKHCIAALGAIGHSVTLEDLDQCFAELKAGQITANILNHSQIPYLRLWWSSTVAELPSFWVNHLLELFRNPIQIIDPTHPLSLGEEIEAASLKSHRSLSFTYYDYAIKQLFEQGDRSRPEFSLAPRELVAKFVAYANSSNTFEGMLVPIFNEESKSLVYYQVSGQEHHSGLHAYLLTPLDKSQDVPAYLTFRGTDGFESAQRDLDPSGVGKRVFDESSPHIRAMVERYTKSVQSPKIEVIGHSLGGADAQRGVALLIDPEYEISLKEIKLFAYCSPKLDKATIAQWNENLKTLNTSNTPPSLSFNFAYHEQDLVTWTGDANLCGFASCYIPSTYLIVKSDSGIAQIAMHHTQPFFIDGNFDFETDNRSFQLLQSIPKDDLQTCLDKLEELKNTSSWYLTIKSFFTKQESIEELEERIARIRSEQAQIKEVQANSVEESWLVWTASRALNYTVQPLVYYASYCLSWFC